MPATAELTGRLLLLHRARNRCAQSQPRRIRRLRRDSARRMRKAGVLAHLRLALTCTHASRARSREAPRHGGTTSAPTGDHDRGGNVVTESSSTRRSHSGPWSPRPRRTRPNQSGRRRHGAPHPSPGWGSPGCSPRFTGRPATGVLPWRVRPHLDGQASRRPRSTSSPGRSARWLRRLGGSGVDVRP